MERTPRASLYAWRRAVSSRWRISVERVSPYVVKASTTASAATPRVNVARMRERSPTRCDRSR